MKSKFVSLRNLVEKSFKAHPGLLSYEATKVPLAGSDALYEISVNKSHKNMREDKANTMVHKYIFDNKENLIKTNFLSQTDSTVVVNSLFFNLNFKKFHSLISHTWVTVIWEFVQEHNITLQTSAPFLPSPLC